MSHVVYVIILFPNSKDTRIIGISIFILPIMNLPSFAHIRGAQETKILPCDSFGGTFRSILIPIHRKRSDRDGIFSAEKKITEYRRFDGAAVG